MLAIFGGLALLASTSLPSPSCEIAMRNWCIAQLPHTIEMKEADGTREWRILTSSDFAKAEVRIIEDRFCGGELSVDSRSASDGSFAFVSEAGCGFRVSVSGNDPAVNPRFIVGYLIRLKRGEHWVPVGF